MIITSSTWTLIVVLAPLAAAAPLLILRSPHTAFLWSLVSSVIVLVLSFLPWLTLDEVPPGAWLAVDALAAPLLPLIALVHLLTVLATSKIKLNRYSLSRHMVGESVRLGAFAVASSAPWLLIVLLIAGSFLPMMELQKRRQSTALYTWHMLLFSGLLAFGQLLVAIGWGTGGVVLLLLAVLIRNGVFPMHLWMTSLLEKASFGTSVLFVTPLIGVFAAVRLVLPLAPDWLLQIMGGLSLVTALYASAMASVAGNPRRFFAYLVLSSSSIVLVGLELHTIISVAGALSLWYSVVIALASVGIVLRAVEARFGTLGLNDYHGIAQTSPGLAAAFLLAGLAAIGFPGTLGFIAGELMIDGTLHANLGIGLGTILVATLNGMAILRAYFKLFTGRLRPFVPGFDLTTLERWAIVMPMLLLFGFGLYPEPLVQMCHRITTDQILVAPAGSLPG